jgi:predicted CXXCH cytochrome family protein
MFIKKVILVRGFIGLAALVIQVCNPQPTTAADPVNYTYSAHGNATTGVSRLSNSPYAIGNCGHCHEQHTANADGFLLSSGKTSANYLAADNICFTCHTGTTIVNNNYGATFGGEGSLISTNIDSTNIEAAFLQTGSTHSLFDIQTYVSANMGLSYSPCSACHNVHIAKANKDHRDNPDYTAISKLSDHNTLWGDDPDPLGNDETMLQYALDNGAVYRAPFYVGADKASLTAFHEPDGASGTISSKGVQGSTTPDYNSFCLGCHGTLGIGDRPPIYWDAAGDKHGAQAAGVSTNQGIRIAPYTIDGSTESLYDNGTNYVLSCLDCHEPHGSSNTDLLRTTVNGVRNIATSPASGVVELCRACHASSTKHQLGADCRNCHFHGATRGQTDIRLF